jgi:hypothetical protein
MEACALWKSCWISVLGLRAAWLPAGPWAWQTSRTHLLLQEVAEAGCTCPFPHACINAVLPPRWTLSSASGWATSCCASRCSTACCWHGTSEGLGARGISSGFGSLATLADSCGGCSWRRAAPLLGYTLVALCTIPAAPNDARPPSDRPPQVHEARWRHVPQPCAHVHGPHPHGGRLAAQHRVPGAAG